MEAGNAAYKKKDFESAIEHYTKAIELDDEDISFLTNMAAVYLEMGKLLDLCIFLKHLDLAQVHCWSLLCFCQIFSHLQPTGAFLLAHTTIDSGVNSEPFSAEKDKGSEDSSSFTFKPHIESISLPCYSVSRSQHIMEKQNQVVITDRMWARLLSSTNQPSFLSKPKDGSEDSV